jgi:hypothetical protein
MGTESLGPYDEREKAAIREYLRKIEALNLPPFLKERVWRGAIDEIEFHFGRVNLVEIEQMLRELGSQKYLAALPVDTDSDYEALLPGSEKIYPYYIMFYGPEEYSLFLQEYEVTPEMNRERLANAGLLQLKKNSETYRRVHALLHPHDN